MYRTNAALENNSHCSFFVEEVHVIYFENPNCTTSALWIIIHVHVVVLVNIDVI